MERGVAWTRGVARWKQPRTGSSQNCVVRGAGREICFVTKCVAAPVSGSRTVTPLVFLEAHSFTRCRTSYPTLPLFPVFRKLRPPSDIFEVKIWSLSAPCDDAARAGSGEGSESDFIILEPTCYQQRRPARRPVVIHLRTSLPLSAAFLAQCHRRADGIAGLQALWLRATHAVWPSSAN